MNHEKISNALRTLESEGFNVKPLWKELASRVEADEKAEPSPEDLKYKVPTEAPNIESHFDGKNPVELEAHVMWPGYHYTLSPGQRRWFREFTALTPSRTVTIGWVQTWKDTQHPRAFKVISDVHLDGQKRKHLLHEFVVRDAGKFFTTAAEFDAEDAQPKVAELTRHNVALGYYYTLTNPQKWGLEDLAECKVGNKVQVVHLGEKITFEAQEGKFKGTRATVDKDEFFTVAEENTKLYSPTKTRKPKAAKNLDFGGFMADLESAIGE